MLDSTYSISESFILKTENGKEFIKGRNSKKRKKLVKKRIEKWPSSVSFPLSKFIKILN